jgi:sugar lactone lactonase YvrE
MWGGVAVGNGKVFVPNTGNQRIDVFQTDGTWLTNFGKQGNPASIAVGSGVSDAQGNLYFADSENSVIRKTDTNFALVSTIGSRGSGEGQFGGNLSLTIAPSGKLIAVDQANNRVEIFNADGSFAKAFGKIGTTNGAFSIPWGVAAGRDGRIFVTDSANNRVQVFDADGNYLSKFGTKGDLDGQFNNPNHIASLPDGRIVVGDRGNSRLQFFDTNGAYLAQTGWNPEHFCVSADGGLYGSWGNIGFYDVAGMSLVKEWGAGAPGPITELPNGDLLHAGTDNVLRLWKRTYRLQVPANGLALPYPAIVNQVRRPGTTLVDIDYLVKDSDSANVTTGILAFKDGQNDLGSIIPMMTFVEGTAAKLGSNIPTGVTNRLTWNAAQDWSTNFGSIQFQVMAKDNRPLLNVDFINIPAVTNAVATNAPLKISRSPLTDSDLLQAWYWLIASKDPSISYSQGKVSSSSSFSFTAPTETTQGLWRTRYNNPDWTGNSESSVVTSINFGTWDWNRYSSYYIGMITPASSGEYEFMISADDNAYWTLNGQSGTNNVAQIITLQAGVPVPLVIYYNNSGSGYSNMQVSWKAPGETDWASVPDNVYSTAVAQPASSNYGDNRLAEGNTTTSAGRAFLFAKMGLREATDAEVTYARSAGMTNGTVNQWAPPLMVGPDERPAAVNSWGFDTGASGYWVVPITVTNTTP